MYKRYFLMLKFNIAYISETASCNRSKILFVYESLMFYSNNYLRTIIIINVFANRYGYDS